MNKVFKNVSFVFLLLKICLIFGQESATQKTILIDVGQGGKDSGAIGINGIQEKDVVLDVALEILSINRRSEVPAKIYLTRYSDTLISLSGRTKLAKAIKADVFVTLHCNHSDNPNTRGVEVYADNSKTEYSEDSVWLAFQLQAALKKDLGFESRGVKFANFQVLQETIEYCHSILLELGFLSNKDECIYYQKPESVKALAFVIWESLI